MPAGKYDNDVDFNIGNNFWSVHSYWAMTFLLGPEWSISLRPQYYYNFKNSDPDLESMTPVTIKVSEVMISPNVFHFR